jgi:hypothetical protein
MLGRTSESFDEVLVIRRCQERLEVVAEKGVIPRVGGLGQVGTRCMS